VSAKKAPPKPTPEESTTQIPEVEQVPLERIAERAYALYLARGAADGHEVDDWLRAETELKGGERDI
jgi:hypothetical protein